MSGIKIKGINNLRRKLKHGCDLTDVAAVVKFHGAQMQQTAQIIAPVDTGFLHDHITLEIKDAGMTAEVASTAEYAAYVEYGTRFMAAQPHIRPAYMQESERFKQDLKRLMQ